jgi:hypothetical protein
MRKGEDIYQSRKPRSDRKRNIKAVISMVRYECFKRIAYITSSPVQDVGAILCMEGLQCKSVIDKLSAYFRRDYMYENVYGDPILYPGATSQLPVKVDRGNGHRAQISMRFYQDQHDKIGAIAYALDLTISSAVALILDTAFKQDLGTEYIARFIKEELLNPLVVNRFKRVLNFINLHSEEPSTMEELFAYLAYHAYDSGQPLVSFLQEWIDEYEDQL